jgi:predicted dehydrogenase
MKPARSAKVLIIGSGSYVIADPYGPGVVLRSIMGWGAERDHDLSVDVTFRSAAKRGVVESAVADIRREVGTNLQVSTLPIGGAAETIRRGEASAVFVCVPDSAHAEYVSLAAASGVPVWVVKPLSGNLESARELVRIARGNNAPIWVDYHKRFDPSNRLLRSVIAGQDYGRPLIYDVQYSQPRNLPLDTFGWAADVDVLTYIGCHYFDQLEFLFPGFEARRVMALPINGEIFRKIGARAHDVVLATVDGEWQGQSLRATFQVGWNNPLGAPSKSFQKVEMTFERGRIEADQMRRGFEAWSDKGVAEVNPYFFQRIHDPMLGADRYAGYGADSVHAFLDYCLSAETDRSTLRKSPTAPWLENTMLVERLLAAAQESLRLADHPWVAVPPAT